MKEELTEKWNSKWCFAKQVAYHFFPIRWWWHDPIGQDHRRGPIGWLTLNHHNANLSDVVSAMTCCAIQENVSHSFCTSHITLIITYTQQYD